MHLSALTFRRQFSRFEEQVRHHSNGQPFTSFRDGLPAEWEDYKEGVRKEALRLLGFQKWTLADVGKGRILEQVIKAIEINDPARALRNNLVDWDRRYGPKSRSHRALLDAMTDVAARGSFEQWFLDFFQGRLAEDEAFERFCQLAGNRYDLVAYLFFLKDWNQFMPIAPTIFDKAFRLLELEVVTARHCSWENYARYNAALLAVQQDLRDVAGVTDARLIDAHSFCWMLVRQELPASGPPVDIPLPQILTGLKALPPAEPSKDQTEFNVLDEERFSKRDAEQRRRGRIAQDIALKAELRRLLEAGHANPNEAVKAVWNESGRGYDILSCELDGTPRHIEVKSARQSGERWSFFLSPNELGKSRSLSNYYFYLVPDVDSRTPSVIMVASGDIAADYLAPANYLVEFRAVRA